MSGPHRPDLASIEVSIGARGRRRCRSPRAPASPLPSPALPDGTRVPEAATTAALAATGPRLHVGGHMHFNGTNDYQDEAGHLDAFPVSGRQVQARRAHKARESHKTGAGSRLSIAPLPHGYKVFSAW
ncbi:hypothetical protein F0U62_37300 [Cystobacter fuscus]|nr:hypothetical protein F0U62_37300 [Cystobacter fuscus]